MEKGVVVDLSTGVNKMTPPGKDGGAGNQNNGSPKENGAGLSLDIPEKFRAETVEETLSKVLKSYNDLEKQFHAPKEKKEEESEFSTNKQIGDPEKQGSKEEGKIFDMDALTKELVDNNGELTKESKEKLNKAGLTDSVINQWKKGVQSEIKEVDDKVLSLVGGKENFQKMREWAGKSLSKEQIKEFDRVMTNENIHKAYGQENNQDIAFAIERQMKSLAEGYQNALNGLDTLGSSNTGGSSGNSMAPFRSFTEQYEMQADPRYRTSQEFRDRFDKRLAATVKAGL